MLEFLITQGHRDLIIEGIFRKLYAEGQNSPVNSTSFHAMLLNKCETIHPTSCIAASKLDLNPFTSIPDSLLSRIANEITQDMIKPSSIKKIENIKNQIKEEVELKYNTFDTDELSSNCNKTMLKSYKYHWESGIEMLSFKGVKNYRETSTNAELSNYLFKFIDDNLTSSRCIESLST